MVPIKIHNPHAMTHACAADAVDALAMIILERLGPQLKQSEIDFINQEFDLTIQAILDTGDLIADQERYNARQ